MRLPLLSLLAALIPAVPGLAHAQAPPVVDTRDAVRRMAFDPSRYFPSPHIRDRSIIRITYTGDDYGWPVYAIAIAAGCVDQENVRADGCVSGLRARMVRAPAPPGMTRPRQRGSHLVNQVTQRGGSSPEQIRAALDDIALEWVEADLRTCRGATAVLGRLRDAEWAPDAVAEPNPAGEELSLVLHADIVRVELQQYARRTIYEGWLAEDSPAVWAESLAAALEPCWRPAATPPPWRDAANAGG